MRLALTVLAVAVTWPAAAAYHPVIGAASVTPARAVAGERITIVYGVTRSDTGQALLAATASCEPSVNGILVPHTDSFAHGRLRLALTVPEDGQALTVKVTVRANGKTATRTTRLPIVQVPRPALTIDDVAADEGNVGTTTLLFPVRLSMPTKRSVSVSYTTADGTALSGSDYEAASGTVTFAPGETTKAISIAVHGDLLQEPDETFTVRLAAPANATLGRDTATGTIVGDELVLLSPARGAVIVQNGPNTGCSPSPTYGSGFLINFSWRTNGRPDIAAITLYLIHPGATMPLLSVALGSDATSYPFQSCSGYVAGLNLAGWTWTVTAYDGSGASVASATSTFSFSDCRLADGSYCH